VKEVFVFVKDLVFKIRQSESNQINEKLI